MSDSEVPGLVFPGPEELAEAAARLVAEVAENCLTNKSSFRFAVPGGRSPRAMLERLAQEPFRESLDWQRITVLFADERAVPPDDPRSNYLLVDETLVRPLGARGPKVVRMRADADDLEAAASEYDVLLEEPLDLIVLGVGEDGHIASLFPGSPLVHERTRRVAPVLDSPKLPPRRLTITPRVFDEAGRRLVVLASGGGKADAVAFALDDDTDPEKVPAALVRDAIWLIDAAAATGLESD